MKFLLRTEPPCTQVTIRRALVKHSKYLVLESMENGIFVVVERGKVAFKPEDGNQKSFVLRTLPRCGVGTQQVANVKAPFGPLPGAGPGSVAADTSESLTDYRDTHGAEHACEI